MEKGKNQKERAPKKKGKKDLSAAIALPKGVSASYANGMITVKGPKGEVSRKADLRSMKVEISAEAISLSLPKPTQKDKMKLGSIEAHVRNGLRGVQEPHKYVLKICSGHFPMNVAVSGTKFTVKNFFGEKVPRVLDIKGGASVKVEGDHITVESPSKDVAGQVSADIEQLTRRPGFDTRIFQDGIYITDKDGKEIK